MRRARFTVVACLLLALPAAAASLRVPIRDAKGQPVADAVVTLAPVDAAAHAALPAPPPPATHIVDQRDEAFVPYVVVFRPGDKVVFRNSDITRHHVYSFSRAKAFEMLLAPGDVGKPMTLDQAGLVAVGCNIHDHMRAWLVVTDAAWVATSGADGIARFPHVPAGEYRAVVWHPQLRPRQPEIAQALHMGNADLELPVSLRLLPDPRGADPHRLHY
jgi:plastocyanin